MDNSRTIDFRYAPPNRWTLICRPDDPWKTLVREDGALLYGYQTEPNRHFERMIEFGLLGHPTPLTVTQLTETARLPVVMTTLEFSHATLELMAFGHLHDGERRTDVVIWTIRAHSTVTELLTGIHVDAYERRRVFVGRSKAPARAIFAADPAQLPQTDAAPIAYSAQAEDETQPGPGELAFVSSPQPLKTAPARGFRPCSGLAMEPVILRAGESISGALLIPQNHHTEAGLDLAWAQGALEAERAFWQALPLPALPLVVPDPAVMDMLTACARNILQAREIEGGLPVFKVGPTMYRGLWVVDGHFILEAAQYLGYAQEASAAIDTLLRRVQPDGSISEMAFHTKETAIAIATLVRQCELLGDDERLRGLWPTIVNAVGYIESLREQARVLPPDDPCANLLPKSFGDGGLGDERGEYATTMWTLAGLKAATVAARRLGLTGDAGRFEADFESLMADFRAHAGRNMQTLPDGTPYLPQCYPGSGQHHWIANYPTTPEPWHHLQPQSATWAMCQAIWPGEVFAPDDPLVQQLNHLNELIDDDEGIPAATGWLPYQAVWNYYASFAAHVWLYCGRPDKAIDYLYAFANHAAPTWVWREEQSLVRTGNRQFVGDMPHNWASAEFIRLVRHLLVFERGEWLELLPGLPHEWLKPGAIVRLEHTPTRFGPVTVDLTCPAVGEVEIQLGFAPEWPRRPQRCLLHLPEAWQAKLNGQPAAVDAQRKVDLPITGLVSVQLRKA